MTQIRYRLCGEAHESQGHLHPYAHILISLEHTLFLHLKSEDVKLLPHQLGFVAPRFFHHCICDGEIIIIDIPETLMKPGDAYILGRGFRTFVLTKELHPLIELIKLEIKSNPKSAALQYLYFFLYNKLVENGESKSVHYMREHFAQKITTVTLAKMENYSVTSFIKWFEREMGCTPSAFLRMLRIEKAKELLKQGQMSILDIALAVGYSNHAAFTRAFRKRMGISPTDYRRRKL